MSTKTKTKTRLHVASLTLLGSLSAVACGQTNDASPVATVTGPTTTETGTAPTVVGTTTVPAATATTTAPTAAGTTTVPSTTTVSTRTSPAATATVTGPAIPTASVPTGTGPATVPPATETTTVTTDTGSGTTTADTGTTTTETAPGTTETGTGTATDTGTTTDTAPPAIGGYAENTGADCQSSAGALAKNNKLPDPFAMHDGSRISSKSEWACRRNEIKKDIEKYEIGEKPEPPTVEASVAGGKLNVVVTTSAGSITLSSTVGSASGAGPSCVVIGMNGNSSLVSGCVQVPFMHDQVVNYNQNGNRSQNDPFYKVYPALWDKVANYSAWSWGISRLIDGLDQVKDELNIDMTKIAVHGCSYAGKMALFGGAFDERVALTIAQESGGGGINSWRLSQDFTTRTGTNIEKIDNTNYSWFLQSMKNVDPYSLPHDHHELIAMIAPRAVIALGNRDYEWLGDESGYKSIMAAKEVWKAMGVEEHIGFDFTTGHPHCSAAQSQVSSVNAFVNKYLKGQDANTSIAIQPPSNGFDLDHTQVIDWQTPTLQ